MSSWKWYLVTFQMVDGSTYSLQIWGTWHIWKCSVRDCYFSVIFYQYIQQFCIGNRGHESFIEILKHSKYACQREKRILQGKCMILCTMFFIHLIKCFFFKIIFIYFKFVFTFKINILFRLSRNSFLSLYFYNKSMNIQIFLRNFAQNMSQDLLL